MSVHISKRYSHSEIRRFKPKTDSLTKSASQENLRNPKKENHLVIKYKSTEEIIPETFENKFPILSIIKSTESLARKKLIQNDMSKNKLILDIYDYDINDVKKFDEQLDSLSSISDLDLEKDESILNDTFDSCGDEDNGCDDVEKIVIFSKSRTYHYLN